MRYLSYLLLFSVCIACLLIAGCSQPGQFGIGMSPTPTEQRTPVPVVQQTSGERSYSAYTTYQMRDGNMIITYQGGPGADNLLYSTLSVRGVEQSKKLGNTPGDTITLEGVTPTSGPVWVIGHFNDGSSHYLPNLPEGGGSMGSSVGSSGGSSGGAGGVTMPSYTIPPRYTPQITIHEYPNPSDIEKQIMRRPPIVEPIFTHKI
jgi:hypothetical protein